MSSIKDLLSRLFKRPLKLADGAGRAAVRPVSDDDFFGDDRPDPMSGHDPAAVYDPTSRMNPGRKAQLPPPTALREFVIGKWNQIRTNHPEMPPEKIMGSIKREFETTFSRVFTPWQMNTLMTSFEDVLQEAAQSFATPQVINPPAMTEDDKLALIQQCIAEQIWNTVITPDRYSNVNTPISDMGDKFAPIAESPELMTMYQNEMNGTLDTWKTDPAAIQQHFEFPRPVTYEEFEKAAEGFVKTELDEKPTEEAVGISSEDLATEFEKAYLWTPLSEQQYQAQVQATGQNDPELEKKFERQRQMGMHDTEIDMHSLLADRVFRSVAGGFNSRKADERLRFFIDFAKNNKYPQDAKLIQDKLASLGIQLSGSRPEQYRALGSPETVQALTDMLVNDFIRPQKDSFYEWVASRFGSAKASAKYNNGLQSMDATDDEGHQLGQYTTQDKTVSRQAPGSLSSEDRSKLKTERDEGIARYSKLSQGINDVGDSIVQHMISTIPSAHGDRRNKHIETAIYLDIARDYLSHIMNNSLSANRIKQIYNDPKAIEELHDAGLTFYVNDGNTRRKLVVKPGTPLDTQGGSIEVAPDAERGMTWQNIDYSKVLGYRGQAQMVQEFIEKRDKALAAGEAQEKFPGEREQGNKRLLDRSRGIGEFSRKDQDYDQSLYTVPQFAMQYLGDWLVDETTGRLRFPRAYIKPFLDMTKLRPAVISLGILMANTTPEPVKVDVVKKYMKTRLKNDAKTPADQQRIQQGLPLYSRPVYEREKIPSIESLGLRTSKDVDALDPEKIKSVIPQVIAELTGGENITGYKQYQKFLEAPDYQEVAQAYSDYFDRILKLADIKDSLVKFGSTDYIDQMMLFARYELDERLAEIRKANEDNMRLL